MAGSAAMMHQPEAIRACTVSRDVQNFDLLIEDMEAEYGEGWGDLTFAQALKYLDQPDAAVLEMLAIAMDDEDEASMASIRSLIQRASSAGIKVLLIAEEISPIMLHQLLRLGAEDFVPYPLPDGALHDAIERLRKVSALPAANVAERPGEPRRNGIVLPVQGLAGGSGATTFAVNLAWELAISEHGKDARVCILDFDLQGGSVSTYLDLPRTERVYELLSDTASMDGDAFRQSVQSFRDRLTVLTSPADMLPLDLLSPDDISRVIDMARAQHDFVIIDMPRTVVQWTETVLSAAQVYFMLMELDMRTAQNTLRLVRALKADDLPMEKFRFVLNRAPKFTDLAGKSRARRMAESLGISFALNLPDGSTQVREANDHGVPLAEFAPKNPLLKEIRKLAASLHDIGQSTDAAAL